MIETDIADDGGLSLNYAKVLRLRETGPFESVL
jgi:hypothetical protein